MLQRSKAGVVFAALQMVCSPASGQAGRGAAALVPMALLGQQPTTAPARSSEGRALCKPSSLPADVQEHLKREFGSWRVQEPADLSLRARERWQAEKPLECPGIAVGHFESARTLSYAVLLVPAGHPDAGYRFLVFTRKAKQSAYEIRVVEEWDKGGAANFFIHRTRMSKFFDKPSRERFQAHTADGILLVGSSENEYGVEVYFWSGGRYRHEPIDY